MLLEITEVSKPVESLNKTEQATEQVIG